MRKAGFLALPLAAVLLLCACLAPAPVPSPAPEGGKAWSLSANHTRLARFAAGDTEMVWACTLELAAFKRGGSTAEGSYEGQLMLTYEVDCYQNQLYTTQPPGLLAYQPDYRSYTLSAPLEIELVLRQDDAAFPKKMLEEYAALVYTRLGAAPLQDEEHPISLYDVDDFGLPLPEVRREAPHWASAPQCVQWESPAHRPLWGEVCQTMMEMAQGAGYSDFLPAAPEYDWQSQVAGWPQNAGDDALPFWAEVTQNGVVSFWLPGLAPFEPGRPFEGRVFSGSSVAATMPSPYDRSDSGLEDDALSGGDDGADDDAQSSAGESGSAASGPYAGWLEKPDPSDISGSGADGDDASTGEDDADDADGSDSSVSEELSEEDALKQALEEYNLPMPPGEVSGPVKKDGVLTYTIEGLRYRDATAYARKLKMGGYKKVLTEVEQPALDIYSLVARSGTGRQLALQYRKGQTELVVF